jgi:hypothetical protein
MHRLIGLGILTAFALVPAVAKDKPDGNASVRGKAGDSEIVVTTTNRLAGAIDSVTWNGKEFIDSFDHGRQLQSACAFDCKDRKSFWAEAYNPTEAGGRKDGKGPRSSSELVAIKAEKNHLETTTRMAFWLPPNEFSPGPMGAKHPAKNKTVLSDVLVKKTVVVGTKASPHLIDYRVTFVVPPTEEHTYAQFEALTGYMPAEFAVFRTFDPTTGKLAALDDGPGEQRLPVVFSTKDDRFAMGIWSPETKPGYGRFRFEREKVVKWNCVFRVTDPNGVKPGEYSYQMFVAVGTLANVTDAISAVAKAK